MYTNGYVCTFIATRKPQITYAWGIRGTTNGMNSTSDARFTLLKDANAAGQANAKARKLSWNGYKQEHNQA